MGDYSVEDGGTMRQTIVRYLQAAAALALAALALGALAFGLARPAGAAPADVVVGNGTLGSCTESALITALPLGTRFVFDCGGPATIPFTHSISFNGLAVIDGGGIITLTGNNATRLFNIGSSGQLSLRNIALDAGYSGNASGGAIYNSSITNSNTNGNQYGGAIATIGMVTLQNSRLAHNNAGFGGAVYVQTNVGSLTLENSALDFNTAQNVGGGGGAVFLDSGANLNMTGGEMNHNQAPVAGGALYIVAGAGATIAGTSATPVYINVNSAPAGGSGGAIYNSAGQLTLEWADLEYNAIPTDTEDYGGAIANLGAMSLSDSRVANNKGRYGGGVFVGGNLISTTAGITHTLFFANEAGAYGGGLYTNFGGTRLSIEDDAFQYNQADVAGGGLARTNATLNISKSSFTYNTAVFGGGLFVQGLPNPSDGPYVEVRDTTISGNLATGQHSGGIDNHALLDLRNVTLKDNGYGLWDEGSATARLQSSVLDNQTKNCDDDGSTMPTSSGHNLSTDGTCNLSAGLGDQISVPSGLGPLTTDPAVFTQFHLPQAGSPLINNGGFGCSVTDQRYATRPDACDIGAIEFGGLLARLWLPLTRK